MRGKSRGSVPRSEETLQRRAICVGLATSGVTLLTGSVFGCDETETSDSEQKALSSLPLVIEVAGATFPYPLYSRWFATFSEAHPEVHFDYQGIGSSAGIRRFSQGDVDLGASDFSMSDSELEKAGGGVLHIPATLGAVVVVHHSPEEEPPLRLTGKVLADIYQGDISSWDDPRIVSLNPRRRPSSEPIVAVHRSDDTGTSRAFARFLARSDSTGQGSEAARKFAPSKGELVQGTYGMIAHVRSTPGAIGYSDLGRARAARLPIAEVQNATGVFVAPTVESIQTAAARVTLPPDLRVDDLRPTAAQSYPLAMFSYLLVRQKITDPERARAIARFLWWATHDGQKIARSVRFAPLPAEVVERVETQLRSIESEGGPALGGAT